MQCKRERLILTYLRTLELIRQSRGVERSSLSNFPTGTTLALIERVAVCIDDERGLPSILTKDSERRRSRTRRSMGKEWTRI